MSGVKDNGEKIGVEACVLKRITKDLLPPTIPLALKWKHLSDSRLAYLDFRPTACITLLLEAEVFTSIVLDGQQTGP